MSKPRIHSTNARIRPHTPRHGQSTGARSDRIACPALLSRRWTRRRSMTHLEAHQPVAPPTLATGGPLDAAHAAHISARATPGPRPHETRARLLPVRNTVADAARPRAETRQENAAAAPDGQRQSRRGGPVRRPREWQWCPVGGSDGVLRLHMQVHGHVHALGRPNTALARLPPRPHPQLVGDSPARRLPPRALHHPRVGLPLHLQPEQEGGPARPLWQPRV
jgi:hypothetical protein